MAFLHLDVDLYSSTVLEHIATPDKHLCVYRVLLSMRRDVVDTPKLVG
jgi:hypothetical protein